MTSRVRATRRARGGCGESESAPARARAEEGMTVEGKVGRFNRRRRVVSRAGSVVDGGDDGDDDTFTRCAPPACCDDDGATDRSPFCCSRRAGLGDVRDASRRRAIRMTKAVEEARGE